MKVRLPGASLNGAELDRLRSGKEARCGLLFDEGEELFDLVRLNTPVLIQD